MLAHTPRHNRPNGSVCTLRRRPRTGTQFRPTRAPILTDLSTTTPSTGYRMKVTLTPSLPTQALLIAWTEHIATRRKGLSLPSLRAAPRLSPRHMRLSRSHLSESRQSFLTSKHSLRFLENKDRLCVRRVSRYPRVPRRCLPLVVLPLSCHICRRQCSKEVVFLPRFNPRHSHEWSSHLVCKLVRRDQWRRFRSQYLRWSHRRLLPSLKISLRPRWESSPGRSRLSRHSRSRLRPVTLSTGEVMVRVAMAYRTDGVVTWR